MTDTQHPLSTPAGRIRWARDKLGWSQYQLATAIGASKHSVARIEAGATLSLDTAARICQAMRFDLTWLAFGIPGANYNYMAFASDITQTVVQLCRQYNMPPNHRELDAIWTAGKARKFAPPDYPVGELESAAAEQLANAKASQPASQPASESLTASFE